MNVCGGWEKVRRIKLSHEETKMKYLEELRINKYVN